MCRQKDAVIDCVQSWPPSPLSRGVSLREDLMADQTDAVPPTRALRILFVSPYDVFPVWTGGRVRIVALARALAELGHQVTILTPWHPRQKPELYRAEPFRVRQVPYPFFVTFLLTDRPFPFLHLMSFHPGYRWAVRPLLQDYDIIQFEHASFAGLLSAVPSRALIGYDAHNVEFDYLRHECHSPRIADMVGRRIHRLESELVRKSDCVFPVSALDQQRLTSLYGLPPEKCTVAPNGIVPARQASGDATALKARFPTLARYRTRALFSGSNADHNRRAVTFLLKEIAPVAPETGFVIHGTCAIPFENILSLPNVFFDRDLDCQSFADYALPGTVGLNLVETGGGTNLKLLQYLSHGLPVLSTPFGLRGYDELARHVRVEERSAFAQALADGLFPAPPSPASLMDRFSWRRIAADMAEAYLRRLAARDQNRSCA